MIDAISGYVRNLVVIVFLVTFLEMLAPENGLRRFVQVVIGFFVLVSILSPLLKLVDSGRFHLETATDAWSRSLTSDVEGSAGYRGERLTARVSEANNGLVKDLARRQLQRLAQSEVERVAPGYAVDCVARVDADGSPLGVNVYLHRPDGGNAGTGTEGTLESAEVCRQVRDAISATLGLARDSVLVQEAVDDRYVSRRWSQ